IVAHGYGRSHGQNRKMLKQYNNEDLEDIDKLWLVPSDNALAVTFLDPRFKYFNWATSTERNKIQNLLEADSAQTNMEEENEVIHYVKFQKIK
ncbi:4094_t:CDS:2, partial [Scutellospora calospora]